MYCVLRNGTWVHLKHFFPYGLPNSQKVLLQLLSTQSNTFDFEKKEILNTSLASKYNPKDVEKRWYEFWESQSYFKSSKPEQESFTLLLPPPNVTGTLHLGHTLSATIQDVILRWKRMKGESVLWIPGVDHAGIATQVAVEKYLNETFKLTKQSLGREEFVKRVWEWKEEKEMKITEQFRTMGCSLDWSNLKFTMDPVHSKIVADAFIQLYNDGLIYRSERVVNWSCALKSSISDIEVDWLEIDKRQKIKVPGYEKEVDFGVLYDIAYKVCDEDDEIVVSTTRPETMLGDVAIAIHPNSSRYSKFKNKFVWHPFRNEKIPVICDQFVRQDLNTEAVKITPSHSFVDFEVGQRHNLKSIEVVGEEGHIKKVGSCEKFHGLRRFDARTATIEELKAMGLFRGCKKHSMKIPVCSRSGDIVEYILKKQWFLNCKELAKRALKVVKNGDLKLQPKGFEAVWHEWLHNIKDWNLSRQIWWGHEIPMYECKKDNEAIWVPALNFEEAKIKGAKKLKSSEKDIVVVKDPDVLDTWFSSGLLPINLLLTNNKSSDNPPISLMVTGHDILFFWVARMVMLSLQLTGKLPFNEVLLHGLMCDSEGKKMSKSLGNVIKPEQIINGSSLDEMRTMLKNSFEQGLIAKKDFKNAEKRLIKMFPEGIPECGVDGLRFTLCCSNFKINFINFDVKFCQSNKHFCNKIWQAMNYFLKVTDSYKSKFQDDFELALIDIDSNRENLNYLDRWILSRLSDVVQVVDSNIADYNFYVSTSKIRLFVVEDFCSKYLEGTKIMLKEASSLQHRVIFTILYHCIETSLRLLSPFMPFLTEELYHALPVVKGLTKCESVTVAEFPKPEFWCSYRDINLENECNEIFKILSTLRSIKKFYNVVNKPNVFIKLPDKLADVLFGEMEHLIRDMASICDMKRVIDFKARNTFEKLINKDCVVYVEHEFNKESLLKNLGPLLNSEENVRVALEKSIKIVSEPDWEKNDPRKKIKEMKKIADLEEKLDRINKSKKAIECCDR